MLENALWSSLFRRRTHAVTVQLFRYTLVGGLAYVVDFGALYLLTDRLGVHYLVSAAVAFALGLTTNYGLSVAWVFDRRRLRNRWLEFGLFALIGLVGLAWNELAMWILTGLAGLHYLLSKVASSGLVYLWNFFARRIALFSEAARA